jgi:hypothetical protein
MEAAPAFSRGMAFEIMKRGESGALDVGGGMGGTSGVSKRTDRRCTLVLEDGSVYSGQSFGSEVFITGFLHVMFSVQPRAACCSLDSLFSENYFRI